jgi:ABC-type Na+ efflux pump permease subunit
MPVSVLGFGKVLGVGAVGLLVSALAGVWMMGAQGFVTIGFNAPCSHAGRGWRSYAFVITV